MNQRTVLADASRTHSLHRTVRALAAHGLPGSLLRVPAGPLPPAEWAALAARVARARLHAQLACVVSDGTLDTTPEQYREVEEVHLAVMVRVLYLEQHLLEVVALLERAGIDHRVLKGSALAHLAYHNPAWRVFGDVDLLVPPHRFDHALDLLSATGFRRVHPRLRQGFDARFGKGVMLEGPDGVQVDLHRTFVPGPFGLTVELEDLFATATPFTIGGRTLRALGPTELVLHACFTVALGDVPPRLVALRDLAQLLLDEELDTDAVWRLAERWGATAVVARAVKLAWEVFELADSTPLSAWSAHHRPGRRDARWLRSYGTPGYASTAFASVGAVRGLRAKAAFVRAVAFPERSFFAERPVGRLRRLLRGAGGWWGRPGAAATEPNGN